MDGWMDGWIDRYSYLYSTYKSKESLGASVAKKMCFQRSSERMEGESRLPKPGWKVIPQSRTGSRETPVAEFVVSSWDEQCSHRRAATDVIRTAV